MTDRKSFPIPGPACLLMLGRVVKLVSTCWGRKSSMTVEVTVRVFIRVLILIDVPTRGPTIVIADDRSGRTRVNANS